MSHVTAHVNRVSVVRNPVTRSDAIVVYITRKVPGSQLRPDEMIPGEPDGIPVRVVEIGHGQPRPNHSQGRDV
jgi:hypothetical protein